MFPPRGRCPAPGLRQHPHRGPFAGLGIGVLNHFVLVFAHSSCAHRCVQAPPGVPLPGCSDGPYADQGGKTP